MKLSKFLRDKLIFILFQLALILFVALIFHGFRINRELTLLCCTGFFLADVCSLFIEYMMKSRYYNRLYTYLEQIDKKQYIASVLERPAFAEAEVLTDVVQQTTKAMNDEISYYQRENDEYREYVETWVHEVKIPISCISLICENNKTDFSADIADETAKIDSFVEQALFYARSTNVERDYNISDISLEAAIKSTVKKHSKQLIATHCKLNFGHLNYTVYSDTKWLDFILGQIISNSIKYRTDHFELTFSSKENDNVIVLSITDNGVGIPECDISRVFDKGFTGENGRNFAKSTGIGLYLSKKLCEKMNLKLEISSATGKGTTLMIYFPKYKALMFE